MKPFLYLSAAILVLTLGPKAVGTADSRETWQADSVLVDKSDRVLHLMHGGRIWKSYAVELGFAPEGHKHREGDGRTPEGRYLLDWRNSNSKFHLSIHISYPDADDRAAAKARGAPPGGDIFVHGTPPLARALRDWTAGCIAVSNEAIEEIWTLVPDGTPITIRP